MSAIRLKLAAYGLVEYFIHPSLRAEPDKLYRARVLSALLLGFNALLLTACAIDIVTDSSHALNATDLVLRSSLILGFIALLVMLRRQGSYFFCSASAVLLDTTAVIIGIGLSGGIWRSQAVLLLAVPVLMAYFFGGIRLGNGATILIGVVVLIFVLMEYAGFKFPQASRSAELVAISQLVICFIFIAAVATMAYIYELTATKLRNARDLNHRKAVALAQTDALTGLVNRRSFEVHLQQRIAAHNTWAGDNVPAHPLVLCYLDLDGFKAINDRHGHAIGDEVLRAAADRLRAALRDSDIIGRDGGDEFTILLHSDYATDAELMAQRTLQALREPIPTSAGAMHIGASLGFATFPDDAINAETLRKAADSAMYAAKRAGGNTWHIASATSTQAARAATTDTTLPVAEDVDAYRPPLVASTSSASGAQQKNASRLVEFFTHPALRLESDKLHRSRILIMALLLIVAVVGANCLVVIFAALPPVSKAASLSINLPIVFISTFLLLRLRRDGNYSFCSRATILLVSICIFMGICSSGGATDSPAAQLMAFPPLAAFFFGGARWGKYVTAASLAALIILFALATMGVNFLNATDFQHIAFIQLLINLVGLATICGMAFIYEFTTATLMRERDAEHKKVTRLAHTDALTGLANRLDFDAELTARISRYSATIPRSCFTLCYLDLDGFKPINDRFGHAVGDEVLQTISARLRDSLRAADYVGRQGGDEFMLIFDAVRTAPQVQVIAERLLHKLALPIQTSAGSVSVTGSLGFAIFADEDYNAATLMSTADKAMYTAKRQRCGWNIGAPSLSA